MKIALPFPRKRGSRPDEPRATRRKRPAALRAGLILGGLIALLSAGGLLYWRSQAAPATSTLSAPVTRGDLTVNVESSGSVKATQSVDLPFQADGQVREVLVQPGDQVRAGQPLARLDDHDLRLQVQQAEADLKTAQAMLHKAQHGEATPQDIATAQINLKAAEVQLQKTRTGNTTAADLHEAQANLQAAQARFEALKSPTPDKVSTARLRLTEAQTALATARDSLSAAKTAAEQELSRATQSLTQAQASYATALENWQYVQDSGRDPYNPSTIDSNGKTKPNKLNDAERQKYYEAFVQAEAALHNAESTVKQAQVSYDSARQKEAAEVPQAEASMADAQQQLDALMHPDKASLAGAQAEVTAAQAKLDKLRQGGTAADVAGAQAEVDKAQLDLEKLSAPAAASDIAAAEADMAQAQAKLDTAKLKLDRATLTAPFAGTVASTSIAPGSVMSTGTKAVSLVDTSALYVDVSLSETDVARVKPGQSVSITFDALPDLTLKGTVESVVPTGSSDQGVVTYPVRVKFDPGQAQVKVAMSASVSVEVERHTNVLQVPNRAIQSSGPVKTIQVLYGKDQKPVTIQVETGATNGSMTEIMKCVDTGKQCLREGDQLAINLPSDTSQGGPAGGDQGPQFFSSGAAPGGGVKRVVIGGP
jgi:HlyD family secretion protein